MYPVLVERAPLDDVRLQRVVDLCDEPECEQLQDHRCGDTVREQVVEFGAHLKDALRGVVGEELVRYLVDERLVVRGGDRGGILDSFTGGGALVGLLVWGGGGSEVLLRVDSLEHQECSSEVSSALFGYADSELLAPSQFLDGRNVLHHHHHLLHTRRRNPH